MDRKKFTEMRPGEARTGDMVLLPAGERRLRGMSEGVLRDMGLSVGRTRRAWNDWSLVSQWLPRRNGPDLDTLLLFADCTVTENVPDDASLLGLDAHARVSEARLTMASLVPVGTAPGQDAKAWTGVWDSATGGAVRKAVAARLGRSFPLSEGDDDMPSLAWDEIRDDVEEIDHESANSYMWFPGGMNARRGGSSEDCYAMPTLMTAEGFAPWHRSRIRCGVGFIENLVERGAKIVRPEPKFRGAITAEAARRVCATLLPRLADRMRCSREFMARMRRATAADSSRLRRCGYAVKAFGRVARTLASEPCTARLYGEEVRA